MLGLKMKGILVLLIVILNVSVVKCANILGIWTNGDKHLHVLGEVLFKELARRGHNVTMVSRFPLKEPFPNYTDIYLNDMPEYNYFPSTLNTENKGTPITKNLQSIFEMTRIESTRTILHEELHELKNSRTQFDVIIMDWFLNFGAFYYGKIFDCPIIALAHQGSDSASSILTGNPSESSYMPEVGTTFFPDMNIAQRLYNAHIHVAINLMSRMNIKYFQRLLKDTFKNTLTRQEMIDKLALVLVNSHYSFGWPRSYVPNMIPIGGFHILPPKELPRMFKTFLDSAENGTIYVSLGWNSGREPTLTNTNTRDIMRTFSQLSYKVIFHWEYEDIKNAPENVLFCKSCPKNDILAHPKVILFINHGGLLDTIEAVHHGVPVLGITVFEDQRINMVTAVRRGYATQIAVEGLDEFGFTFAVEQIVNDKSIKETAKKLSSLLKDQPMPPMDTAVHWVEHVLRHRSGAHLRSYATELSWIEYYMADIIFIMVSVFLFLLSLAFYSVRNLSVVMQVSTVFVYFFLIVINVCIFETHIFVYRLMSEFNI